MMLSEFYARLSLPERSEETQAEYMALPKGRKDDLKDKGGVDQDVLASLQSKGDGQEALMQALKARIQKARSV